MKKLIILFMALFLVLPMLSAVDLTIIKTSSNEVLVPDLGGYVNFNLQIKNNGPADDLQFYNLLGFTMFPIGTISIAQGETRNIELRVSPIDTITARGPYSFEYYIKGQDGTSQKEKLNFRISNIDGAFTIGSASVDPTSNSIDVYIQNTLNFDFGNISVQFSSPFFDVTKNVNLGPMDKKTVSIELNKDDFKQLIAGFYTLNADITIKDKTTSAEGVINFEEKDILKTDNKNYGVLVNTQIIKKSNDGNVVVPSESIINKNIISRLFTTFSPEPDSVERDGFSVYYRWSREIKPGESLEINVKTNWFYPLIIVILLIIIVALVKTYSTNNVVLRKRVSFVRAKGADFGLKVSILIKARKYVEAVNVFDRLPPLVKVYEKFGSEKPTRVNEGARKIEWNFEKLEEGETRILTYIIYSKVGVLGRFALPSTIAVYQRDGKIKESSSNKAFFVAEQNAKQEED